MPNWHKATEEGLLPCAGSGASGDCRSQKALSWTEDRQAAKHKCLVSGCFPSLTRVTGHASVCDEGLLSADAPEPFAEHRWIMPGYSKGCGAMTVSEPRHHA